MSYVIKIIEDSIYDGSRLTTFQLRYPRFIHAEFMTHRVFSRNASSSRAIPVEKMIKMVREEPATPCHWGKNQKGMQADQELSFSEQEEANYFWKKAADQAANVAEEMMNLGLHKQVANRILEPFQWMNVVVTASDYENFFSLRCHKDAEPNIQKLAYAMRDLYRLAHPYPLKIGEYHLPYVSREERMRFTTLEQVKFSVARCARVSYLTFEGKEPEPDKDIDLYNKLVGGIPLHASPAEHQAKPHANDIIYGNHGGNFGKKWDQYRKFLEVNITEKFVKNISDNEKLFNEFDIGKN